MPCARQSAGRIAALLLIMLALAGCQPPGPIPTPTATPAVADGQTGVPPLPTEAGDGLTPGAPEEVAINLGNPPLTLDPMRVAPLDDSAADLVENLFAGLVQLNADTRLLELGLARGWDQLEGGLTWRLRLRDDIFWVRVDPASGQVNRVRPITADDFVFAVRRACQPALTTPLGYNPGLFLIKGCREVSAFDPALLTPALTDQMLVIQAIDDLTIEVQLTVSSASFPAVLAMPMLRPVPADLVAAEGDGWTEPDTIWTSGPFAMQPASAGEDGYTLVANPYWPVQRSGTIDTVRVSFGAEAERLQRWEDGSLALAVVPETAIRTLQPGELTAYRLLARPVTVFLALSYDTPPLDNGDVRRALAAAIDRQAVIDRVLVPAGSAGIPAPTLVPPGTAGAAAQGEPGIRYDPDAARLLLTRAGYAGCNGMPPVSVLADDTPLSASLMRTVIRMWEEVLRCDGVFTLTQMPAFEVYAALQTPPLPDQARRAGITALAWQADYPDAQHWLADILGCRGLFPEAFLNQARPCSSLDEGLIATSVLHDSELRVEILAGFEAALFGPQGEMPVIPIYYDARALAIQPWLEIAPQRGGPLRFDRWIVHPSSQP
jgi:oligopeptide transport system substrate-binding protein